MIHFAFELAMSFLIVGTAAIPFVLIIAGLFGAGPFKEIKGKKS